KPAFRIVVNTPAALGAVGYTTNLFPSMTLGCGAPGNNITSDNISPLHLINLKRVAYGVRDAAAPSPAVKSAVIASPSRVVIEKVVDQWLGGRSVGAAEVGSVAAAAAAAPSTPAPVAPPLQSFRQLESKPAESRVEKAPRKPVPFVCEDDVRAAIAAH